MSTDTIPAAMHNPPPPHWLADMTAILAARPELVGVGLTWLVTA